MKRLAYWLNIAWLVYFVFLLIDEGLPLSEEVIPVFVALVTLLLNIAALARSPEAGDGWLSLFLHRKALEEKQRISAIKNVLQKD